MRLLHELAKIHATFDDRHLVSHAGLVPVMALAQRAGLGDLAGEHVRIARPCGVNAQLKVALPGRRDDRRGGQHRRHGPAAPRRPAGSVRRDPGAVHAGVVPARPSPGATCCSCRRCTGRCWRNWPAGPRCCPARARSRSWTSIRSRNGSTGTPKQGAAFGHTKIQGKSLLVRGLNVLAATICTPLAAPVIAGTRLRGGNAASARGAASMITEGAGHRPRRRVHRHPGGADGLGVLRRPGVRAARQAGAYFSVTVRMDPKVRAAITAIPRTPGRRSVIPAPSGMTSSAAGSPTPRSPRCPIRPSPHGRGRRSPPG